MTSVHIFRFVKQLPSYSNNIRNLKKASSPAKHQNNQFKIFCI